MRTLTSAPPRATQRRDAAEVDRGAPAGVPAYLRAGRALPHQATMEAAFGSELATLDLQVETGASAGAERAWTDGRRLVFSEARPSAEVVAHEVTHALQVTRGASSTAWASSGSPSEREAAALAPRAACGEPVQVREAAGGARMGYTPLLERLQDIKTHARVKEVLRLEPEAQRRALDADRAALDAWLRGRSLGERVDILTLLWRGWKPWTAEEAWRLLQTVDTTKDKDFAGNAAGMRLVLALSPQERLDLARKIRASRHNFSGGWDIVRMIAEGDGVRPLTERQVLRRAAELAENGNGLDNEDLARAVTWRAATLLNEENRLRSASGGSPEAQRRRAERLAELGDVGGLLAPQLTTDGTPAEHSFWNIIGDATSPEYAINRAQALGVSPTQLTLWRLANDESWLDDPRAQAVALAETGPAMSPAEKTRAKEIMGAEDWSNLFGDQLVSSDRFTRAMAKLAVAAAEDNVDWAQAVVSMEMTHEDRAKLRQQLDTIHHSTYRWRIQINLLSWFRTAQAAGSGQNEQSRAIYPSEGPLAWLLNTDDGAVQDSLPDRIKDELWSYNTDANEEQVSAYLSMLTGEQRQALRRAWLESMDRRGTNDAAERHTMNGQRRQPSRGEPTEESELLQRFLDAHDYTGDQEQSYLDELLGVPLPGETGGLSLMDSATFLHHRVQSWETVEGGLMSLGADDELQDRKSAAKDVKELYEQIKASKTCTEEQYLALYRLYDVYMAQTGRTSEALEQVATIASTITGVAVAVVLIVATKGAAAPLAAKILGSVGLTGAGATSVMVGGELALGVASSVGTQELVQGDFYDPSGAVLQEGAVAGVTLGIGKFVEPLVAAGTRGAGLMLRSADDVERVAAQAVDPALADSAASGAGSAAGAQSTTSTLASAAFAAMATEGLTGAATEVVVTLADERAWRDGILRTLSNSGAAILQAGLVGAASAAPTSALDHKLSSRESQDEGGPVSFAAEPSPSAAGQEPAADIPWSVAPEGELHNHPLQSELTVEAGGGPSSEPAAQSTPNTSGAASSGSPNAVQSAHDRRNNARAARDSWLSNLYAKLQNLTEVERTIWDTHIESVMGAKRSERTALARRVFGEHPKLMDLYYVRAKEAAARYGLNLQGSYVGHLAADRMIRQEYPDAVPVFGELNRGQGSSGEFDLIYRIGEGPTAHYVLVEAKGYSSRLGYRKVNGERVRQGSRAYRDDIIRAMRRRYPNHEDVKALDDALSDPETKVKIEYLLVRGSTDPDSGALESELHVFDP